MPKQTILVTGAAGFIGFHVAQRLLRSGQRVLGLDNLNSYYDPQLKEARLAVLKDDPGFAFVKLDIADRDGVKALFAEHSFTTVLHFAAQAGVRYSIENPHAYSDTNLEGFLNILEGCRHNACRHLVFASSSSVYGTNDKLPFSVHDNVDHPISLYAATKKANELMAHSYSHLYGLPATGLRFFTVYGPWGRPDMAIYRFAKSIIEGTPIKLFNSGDMRRDFTYIDDVTEAIVRLIDRPPVSQSKSFVEDSGTSKAPWRIFNIGNSHPEQLMTVVRELETQFNKIAITEMLPMQPGDMPATYADIEDLTREVGFMPATSIAEGIAKFATWYRDYHKI